jgi:hypothetical protein
VGISVLITRLIPIFEIGKNSNSVNPGYPRQSRGGFERVLTGTGFIVMLEAYLE